MKTTLLLLTVLLAACTQPQQVEQIVPEVVITTEGPFEPYDYSETGDVLKSMREDMVDYAQEYPQGLLMKTALSPLARKALASVKPGDIKGYYATLSDGNYGEESLSDIIAVLSAADLLALSKAKAYLGRGSDQDDCIFISLAKPDGGEMDFDIFLYYSMPDIIFISQRVGRSDVYLHCAVKDAKLWKKLHRALVEI